MNRKRLKASMTIEMSFLVSFILFLIMGLILSVFYFHDKNILHGAAYETAITGSVKMREKDKVTEDELISFCKERLRGKCIFLTAHTIEVSIGEDEIIVSINAGKKGFKASVQKKAAVTEPEKKIRDIRRLKLGNGAKNNN